MVTILRSHIEVSYYSSGCFRRQAHQAILLNELHFLTFPSGFKLYTHRGYCVVNHAVKYNAHRSPQMITPNLKVQYLTPYLTVNMADNLIALTHGFKSPNSPLSNFLVLVHYFFFSAYMIERPASMTTSLSI